MILRPGSQARGIAGIGLLEFALPVKIPTVDACLVFTAGLATVDQPTLQALLIGIRLRLGIACQLRSLKTAIAVRVEPIEAGFGPPPFVHREAAIAIDVELLEEIA